MHKPAKMKPSGEPDAGLSSRLAVSALAVEGEAMENTQFFQWLDARQREQAQQVERVAFKKLQGWDFDPGTGNLRHRSGSFFSVQGLRVLSDFGPVRAWSQPIIRQPEIGILGIAVREINGILHCLMQAKSEPGNVNGVQLSPTVQATKSNYMRVHGGSAVRYLDCFRSPDPQRVLADVLQSEQGTWFLRKRNRNMVVEVGPEVEAGEDFCWLTLGQVNALLRIDNLINMDARTVLSCLPDWSTTGPESPESPEIRRSSDSDVQIRSWITRRQVEHDIVAQPVGLAEVSGWHRSEHSVSHESGRYFSIIAVDIASHRREVPAWSQPLLEPHGIGVSALLVKRVDGIFHALVNARAEPGFLDVVELGPTLQYTPESYAHLPSADQPRFADVVAGRGAAQTLFDVVLSEEGGRFHHAQCRYLIIEVEEEFHTSPPEDFRWITLSRLSELLKYSHYVNVQARTLIAALRAVG